MTSELTTYPGYRFPAEVISHAIWLYHVFGLSFRDVELLLAERGIPVTHESIRQWAVPPQHLDPIALTGGAQPGDWPAGAQAVEGVALVGAHHFDAAAPGRPGVGLD